MKTRGDIISTLFNILKSLSNDNKLGAEQLYDIKILINCIPKLTALRQEMVEIYQKINQVTQEIKLQKPAEYHVNIADEKGMTLLMYAVRTEMAVIDVLLEAKAEINKQNLVKDTALTIASYHGRNEIIERLINAKANLDITNSSRETAILIAARYGHTKIVNQLVNAKANLDRSDSSGDTALLIAVRSNYFEISDLLINAKANLNSENKNGDTALICAASRGRAHIVSRLIEANAILDCENEHKTALIVASSEGYEVIVDKLLSAKANIESKDPEGSTALIAAASSSRNCFNILTKLINAKADVNAQNKQGETSLIKATRLNSFSIVKMLLEAKAEPDIQDKRNLTALIVSAINSYTQVADLLIHGKADPNIYNAYDSKSALDYAIERDCLPIVDLLLKNNVIIRNPKQLHEFLFQMDQRSPFVLNGLTYLEHHQTPNLFKVRVEDKKTELSEQQKRELKNYCKVLAQITQHHTYTRDECLNDGTGCCFSKSIRSIISEYDTPLNRVEFFKMKSNVTKEVIVDYYKKLKHVVLVQEMSKRWKI